MFVPLVTGDAPKGEVLITSSTTWAKPFGVTRMRVLLVGGGGSGSNQPYSEGYPGGSGVPGSYNDSGWLTVPGGDANYSVSIGAPGYDGDPGWSWGADGGASYVSGPGVSRSAGGGAAYSSSIPYGTYSASGFPYASCGRGGAGQPAQNEAGSYGAVGGGCYIYYE